MFRPAATAQFELAGPPLALNTGTIITYRVPARR